MKIKIFYIFVFIVVTLSAACSGDKRYDYLMQRADSIMDRNDDSAKVSIQLLESIKPQLDDLTKRQQMRYELLYHKAMNKAGVPFTSDTIMKKVVRYYENHGSANERMLANYELGCVYRDLHETPMALEYYDKATERADTTAADCDYGTLYRVYRQMGILFDKQYLPYQLLDAFSKAEKYAYLAKDTFNAIISYQDRGTAYFYLGKKDSMVAINLHASKLFKRYGDDYNAAIALGCNCSYYIDKKDKIKAKESFEAYASTGYGGNSDYEDSKAFVLCERGRYYIFANQLDSAYDCLSQSLLLCKSYSVKAAVAGLLAQYYAKVNQPILAMKYALQSSELNDSDLIEARKSQLQQLQAMYDYGRYQETARKAERKAEVSTRINYMIVICCLMILMFLTCLYRKQLGVKKKKIMVTKQLYEDCLVKLKRAESELRQLISENDKQLAHIIIEKENAISKLKQEMMNIRARFSIPLASDIDLLLMESSICKKIKYIELHPKIKMCEEDWKSLYEAVEGLIPTFITLKDKLKETDYRICLLVRLGFSTSLMAILLDLSASAISKHRRVMLEKLWGKSGKPKDFDELIRKIQ